MNLFSNANSVKRSATVFFSQRQRASNCSGFAERVDVSAGIGVRRVSRVSTRQSRTVWGSGDPHTVT